MIFCGNPKYHCVPHHHTPSEVVLPAKEVHSALGDAKVIGNGDAGLAVDEHGRWARDVEPELAEKLTQVHVRLTEEAATSNLSLGGAVADDFDEFGGPVDWRSADRGDVATLAGEFPGAVDVAV